MSFRYVPFAIAGTLLLSGLIATLEACRASKPTAAPSAVGSDGLDASVPDAAPAPPPPPVVSTVDPERIESFVTSHAAALTKACWTHNKRKVGRASTTLTMTLNIDGQVLSVKASGSEASIDRCIEQTVRHWHFPTIDSELTVAIPLKFRQ